MPISTHKYTNGEITIIWEPAKCIHSAICWKNLGEVFDPKKRPWINAMAAPTARIEAQVKNCPSGALGFIMNKGAFTNNTAMQQEAPPALHIQVLPNGPLLVKTDCMVTGIDGQSELKKGTTALCRCGASANKPYCDGTHGKINFQG